MIEVLLKNKEILRIRRIEELEGREGEVQLMQFAGYTEAEVEWVRQRYGVNTSIMHHYEDIEISSHFLSTAGQAAFHIPILSYDSERTLVETPMFGIVSPERLFFFLSAEADGFFAKAYAAHIPRLLQTVDTGDLLRLQIKFIADYYADITESETRNVKSLAGLILLKRNFSNDVMNLITHCSFNNLLVKEALLETTRVFNLYRKSDWGRKIDIGTTLDAELDDLAVVSDYIRFNFDRLEDLKENVANKIDIEQNAIFKKLTVVTVCISLPMLIAGIYGMNFERMPELKFAYGYPAAIVLMLLSAVLSYVFFKRKKWL